jgi:crotonobetainyl-CoA:carnitine CoA-transferase CaiB-like acyl-CoA transferase
MDDAARTALRKLLSQIGLAEADAGGPISIHGQEPVVPSRHRLGTASAVALAAQGTAIAAIWRQRSGRGQTVDVDLCQAAVPGMCTSDHLSQSGYPVDRGRNPAMAANFFATQDGRRLYILRAAAYVPHMLRLLEFLGCANTTEAIAAAVARWRADALEEALAEHKIIGTIARTREEWLAHPQGQWLAARPPVEIEKIGDSPREPFAAAARPLSGIRVLDMAHVLAGPVTSRVLAEQGADVLHVSAPHQPDQFVHILDTGMGKRRAFIDLDRGGAAEVQSLADDADIFVHSWRPGSLERHGLSATEMARRRPGLIYVTVSCYGYGGPWASRGGYEPIGQTASGLAIDEGTPDQPLLAPTFTLNDYVTAYLAAAGTLGALVRRAREGGSYHVKASLTRTSMWVQELGRLPQEMWPDRSRGRPALPAPRPSDMMRTTSVFGEIGHPAPITRFSETKAFWERPPQPAGASRPEWLPRG